MENKKFNPVLFIVLACLGVVPAIIYYIMISNRKKKGRKI